MLYCVKCNSTNFSLEYVGDYEYYETQNIIGGGVITKRAMTYEDNPSYLNCKCSRCGYSWTMKTFDKMSVEELDKMSR